MPGLQFSVLLKIDSYTLMRVMLIFIIILGLLFICTLVFFIYKKRINAKIKSWEDQVSLVVSTAVFNLDEEFNEIISKNANKLKNHRFRQYLINEIILARKSLSGSASENIKMLYENLGLNNDSFKKLHNKKWHIKAKGVQELAIMEQTKYVKQIFRLTNNKSELVRNESQCALVSFYGFSGLRFLGVTTYTLSEWQQIQLLNKLHDVKPRNFDIIKKWLQSPNESVVNFSLRLATFYNRFDVYPDVMDCLSNTSLQVKLNTLNYLKRIPREDTAGKLVDDYSYENKSYKLAIINALNDIGNEEQIAFLLKQLHHSDNDIKLAAAKSLSHLHPLGIEFLKTHLFAHEDPWKTIFLQIENEHMI
ncbi:HEAT repeat domain-containing protein [Ginsengibacter hankyongi]|uniref:HEAT repeat domain-containing protein n=1 Tax=Ginsengibacter hankyongi TaxID=2607284 RepID=A0A5J5IFN2_9BACT|nr:HEAT repeat domain-containing protein [Ginsengibacter hankyongi]KAA9036346.1 HEAT repeat domain-containing protein [Ginsengibacter hankyongi]